MPGSSLMVYIEWKCQQQVSKNKFQAQFRPIPATDMLNLRGKNLSRKIWGAKFEQHKLATKILNGENVPIKKLVGGGGGGEIEI